MEDIIWYLHKFVDRKIYTLLNKKCRDVYYGQLGIHMSNSQSDLGGHREMTIIPFLSKYKIHLHIDWIDYPITCIFGIDWVNCEHVIDEISKTVKSNIISITVYKRSLLSVTINLINTLPNLKQISGVIRLEKLENLDLYSSLPKTVSKKIVVKILDTSILTNLENIDKNKITKIIENIKTVKGRIIWYSNNMVSDFQKIINVICIPDDCKYNHFTIIQKENCYPELTTIKNIQIIPDIIAPKLTKITTKSIFIACQMVKKYKTIKEIGGFFEFEDTDFTDFVNACNYLTDNNFTIKIKTQQIEKLLESPIRNKSNITIKIYNYIWKNINGRYNSIDQTSRVNMAKKYFHVIVN